MEIRIHKKPELKGARMIVGLPGRGMVARNTVNYLLESLNPEFFADIHVPYLSPSIVVFNKGLLEPVEREASPFKFYYSKEENIVLFSGEMQFGYVTKDNELADKIIEVARLCDVDVIYTVISTAIPKYVEEPKVFGVATTNELLEHLRSKGMSIAERNVQVSGVNGLVIEYALKNGIKGISLMVETALPEVPDIKASYAGIKKISELLEIDIDLGKIESEVKKFDESLKNYMKEIQDMKKKDEDISYIG